MGDLFMSMKITLNETDSSFELTEESVRSLLDRLNLVIDNKWYDGNKSRSVFDCHDKFDELGETVCVFVEPPYEARVWYKDLNPRVNHYTEGIETLDELEEVLREFFKISPNESKQNEYHYSNEEYLQDVYDALVAVMDTDKFNMIKGYNDEYECDCITIVPTDTNGTRAIVYVNDYGGRHPAAFDVVYRYPGDKGVGIMGTYEFQSTDLDETAPEIFDYFDEVSSRSATALSEEDSKKYADSLVGKEYNVDSIVSDGWDFVSDVEMHDELNRATFNANVDGRKSMLVVDYNPNTDKVVDSSWDYYAVESKQDEADYSTSRVSKPIADAYSLLDGYFCDEDGRLTDDAVDKIYLTFQNERDLYDRSKSRAVKSHSLAWDALLREINATLEWDDENPHATSLTSEQVKNWFKLKGRDYKEELKPLVAVIDAYRNNEY
jgi:hypothetical protein